MALWARLRSFWHNVLHRSDLERNMSDELQFHLERRAEDLIARGGLSPAEAMRIARLEFGSVEKYKEEARQSLGLRLFDESRGDLRYAFRTFGRSKGFTAAAIATLALGIGANTAVFSVVDALLLRKLPVKNPEELVVFDWLRTDGFNGGSAIPATVDQDRPLELGVRTSFSALTVERFREHTATLSDVFAFSPAGTLNIVADGQADTASGLFVTGGYFAGLGVGAIVGRTLSASDDRPEAEPVAVISHRYWRRRFAGDPSVVGKTIDVNRSPVVIVGITPEGFDGPRMSESSDITLPTRDRGASESDGPRPAGIGLVAPDDGTIEAGRDARTGARRAANRHLRIRCVKAGRRARPIRQIRHGASFHSSVCALARKDPMAPASMHSRSCPRCSPSSPPFC